MLVLEDGSSLPSSPPPPSNTSVPVCSFLRVYLFTIITTTSFTTLEHKPHTRMLLITISKPCASSMHCNMPALVCLNTAMFYCTQTTKTQLTFFSSLTCLSIYNAILHTSIDVHIHAQADVCVLHVPGENSQVADALSCMDFAQAKHLVPALSISPFTLFMPSVPPPSANREGASL